MITSFRLSLSFSVLLVVVGFFAFGQITEAAGIPSGTNLTPSGPIVINGQSNVTISGKKITNPNGTCIEIKNGSSNITIKNSEIGPCGDKGITVTTSSGHVTIQNNYIHDVKKDAVWSYDVSNVAVDSNQMERVQRGYGMWQGSGNVSFTNNFVKNVIGGGVVDDRPNGATHDRPNGATF